MLAAGPDLDLLAFAKPQRHPAAKSCTHCSSGTSTAASRNYFFLAFPFALPFALGLVELAAFLDGITNRGGTEFELDDASVGSLAIVIGNKPIVYLNLCYKLLLIEKFINN